ncbi:sigma factor-like helix-turn-helix DNA-binding protein [Streptomyces luteireticuli]|uniref:sigma factor-like helix-turn-helix DNA-binding protein n=1 Tax=Streptomyces luteireticuli TaxID=173858 RepID=UPI003555D0BD
MPGTIVERRAERPWYQGNGPDGRRLERGEIVALEPKYAERLSVLFERYGERVLNYARRRLLNLGMAVGAAGPLAQDIAQDTWVRVARTGAKDALRCDDPADDEVLPILFSRVKQQIGAHFRRQVENEAPVDWQAPETCAALCPLLPEGCALAALPAALAAMVARLPERERRALLLKLDGLPVERIAEHLECSGAAARRVLSLALVLLQVSNPELPGESLSADMLPAWEQEALAKIGQAQRAALLRVEETARRSLLLLLAGASTADAAARLGVSVQYVRNFGRALTALEALDGGSARPAAVPGKDQAIVDALRGEVARLRPGSRLPSNRELMARFGCASRTVTKGMQVLRAEGLIEANGTCGYTVARSQADMERAA